MRLPVLCKTLWIILLLESKQTDATADGVTKKLVDTGSPVDKINFLQIYQEFVEITDDVEERLPGLVKNAEKFLGQATDYNSSQTLELLVRIVETGIIIRNASISVYDTVAQVEAAANEIMDSVPNNVNLTYTLRKSIYENSVLNFVKKADERSMLEKEAHVALSEVLHLIALFREMIFAAKESKFLEHVDLIVEQQDETTNRVNDFEEMLTASDALIGYIYKINEEYRAIREKFEEEIETGIRAQLTAIGALDSFYEIISHDESLVTSESKLVITSNQLVNMMQELRNDFERIYNIAS
ncbi:hypothetical protein QAD02_005971 [Eretmocerus hayati]|uniref:Uncharacterized protein n=1 Tax=Eretmocerus hayati TaxID=131215 RepID=A0ACC2N1Y5_9HYME|nr:hypothetical protein QAD02_005971 [Eretmocerus hayati]